MLTNAFRIKSTDGSRCVMYPYTVVPVCAMCMFVLLSACPFYALGTRVRPSGPVSICLHFILACSSHNVSSLCVCVYKHWPASQQQQQQMMCVCVQMMCGVVLEASDDDLHFHLHVLSVWVYEWRLLALCIIYAPQRLTSRPSTQPYAFLPLMDAVDHCSSTLSL